MKGFLTRPFAGLFLLGLLGIFFGAHAQTPAPLPLQAFSSLPAFSKVTLSPDGNRLAYVQNINEPEDLSVLTTYDISTDKVFHLVRSDNEKVKINWFRWANNTHLIISARYESKQGIVRFYETRLYSMAFDDQGAEPVNLIDWRRLRSRMRNTNHSPQFQDDVIDWLPDDPDHILIAVDINVPLLPAVYKVNIHTAKMARLNRGVREIRDWVTDQQGNVRIGVSLDYDSGKREILLQQDDGWQTLFSYNVMSDKAVYPMGFGVNPNILYYRAYKGDFKAVYRMDLASGETEEVFADENYDVDGDLIYSPATNDAIGVYHSQAENGTFYWDPRYQQLQDAIDKALPDSENSLISFSRDENVYILYTESDNEPGGYFLGNRKEGKLDGLFSQYPQIDPGFLPAHEKVSYKSRDGTEIEGYLTLPKHGKPPYATVVHPHGGPGARDYAGFDVWTAYLANQGYAVFRPNFRGSSGYGFSFAQAQMKSWGLTMQDDITDAANYLVDSGVADAQKMCIFGASYGGYAALMATVKTPNLFRCAVSFAGVSDLKRLVIDHRPFVGTELVKNQIGDDFDDLEARSPINFVEKITTPILLIHGDEDRVVRVTQSRDMADELEDHKKVFKYVELEAGDHYLSIQRNRTRFMQELDDFLRHYLKS